MGSLIGLWVGGTVYATLVDGACRGNLRDGAGYKGNLRGYAWLSTIEYGTGRGTLGDISVIGTVKLRDLQV